MNITPLTAQRLNDPRLAKLVKDYLSLGALHRVKAETYLMCLAETAAIERRQVEAGLSAPTTAKLLQFPAVTQNDRAPARIRPG